MNDFIKTMYVPSICDGKLPEKATSGAAAVDLRSSISTTIDPGKHALIPTGLRAAIPNGFMGLVLSRLGLAAKHGGFVLNAPGVIDSDCRCDIGVVLANFGSDKLNVAKGDRVAKFTIVRVPDWAFCAVSSLDDTDRGDGGFGSTGSS